MQSVAGMMKTCTFAFTSVDVTEDIELTNYDDDDVPKSLACDVCRYCTLPALEMSAELVATISLAFWNNPDTRCMYDCIVAVQPVPCYPISTTTILLKNYTSLANKCIRNCLVGCSINS